MSVWATEEVMRWALRFCSRRYPWQQHRFLQTASIKDAYFTASQQRAQVCVSLPKSLVGSVRFFSQDRSRKDVLEEFSSPPELDDPASDQRQMKAAFSDKLYLCASPADVLDLACQHELTVGQICNSLTHLWATTKRMSEEQRRYELRLMYEHPAFEQLLQKAMRTAGHMHHRSLTFCLLSIVKLGVNQQSRVVQTHLRFCQEKLNDFDEKSLSVLASTLKHMESSANVNALKEGMRLIVDARLPQIRNVVALQTMMRLVGKDAPPDLKKKLEKKALSMADQFTLPNTQYMVLTMAAMDFYSKPLMDLCSQRIAEDFHTIPFNRLYKVLVSFRELLYRNTELLTGLSEYVASTLDIWTNRQLLLFLASFEELSFCPDALLEAFAEKVISNHDFLTLKDLSLVLKVYSSLNYDLRHQRQPFLDILSDSLNSYLPKMPPFLLLKAVYGFCLLGHFPSAPLELLLQSNTLEQLNEWKFAESRDRMLQMLDSCLSLDRPRLPRPLAVPSSGPRETEPCQPTINPRLSKALQSLTGGETNTTLQEVVEVENFYVVDAVITKPLPEQTSRAEAGVGASPAESSQRIAVVYAPKSAFCYGTSKPRGLLAVKIRHLKILGFTPVLVTDPELQSDDETTTTETLRRRIFPELHGSETQSAEELLGS